MRSWLLLLALSSFAAHAEEKVYKWVDKNGVVHYTDKAPSKDARPANLPPLQTYEGGKMPDLGKLDATPAADAAPPVKTSVQIVQPAPDETFRDVEGGVGMAVIVSPGLQAGQQLRYYLDGAPQGPPTTSTAYVFRDLERGSHALGVAVLDGQGREVARSAVTVHLKPPAVRSSAEGDSGTVGQPPQMPRPVNSRKPPEG